MPNYAVLSENFVLNVIVAEDIESAKAVGENVVELTGDGWIGWTYDPLTNQFTAPVVEEVANVEGS